MNAVQQVWMLARVRIHFWCAKNAIQMKFKDSSKLNSLAHHMPGEVLAIVPSIKIYTGLTRRNYGLASITLKTFVS